MVVSHQISRTIGLFGLSRATLLDMLAHVYEDIPRKYEAIKNVRMNDIRLFVHRYVSTDESGVGHLFIFGIDDTTSPDHLMLAQIKHKIV